MLMSGAKTRERVTAQIKGAADKIGATVLACLAVAVGAVLLAAAALFTASRALRAVRAAA